MSWLEEPLAKHSVANKLGECSRKTGGSNETLGGFLLEPEMSIAMIKIESEPAIGRVQNNNKT